MLAKLNNLIQHEATQTIRNQPINNPADGQPIPPTSTEH